MNGRPGFLRIEASSMCQLRCPSCPRAQGSTTRVIGNGYLRADDFARLMRANPWVAGVELSNWGEAMLSPDLAKIFQIAQRLGVRVFLNGGVNFNHATDDQLNAMVQHGVRKVAIAIDGATPETYAQYRVGGNLKTVLTNIDRLNAIKRAKRSSLPRLTWQMVMMRTNAHEIQQAKAMAAQRDMDFLAKLCWDPALRVPIDDLVDRVNIAYGAPESGPDFERRMIQRTGDHMCMNLWRAPQLNWDGTILGCVYNYSGDFGRVSFDESLLPRLEKGLLGQTRRALAGEIPMPADSPCARCEFYTDRVATGHWLTPQRRSAFPPQFGGVLPWRLIHHAEEALLRFTRAFHPW